MQKITTYLWFDKEAEAAVDFYTSVFDDSRVLDVQRLDVPGQEPSVATVVTFELAGQRFIALNGGPQFTFNEAISLYVDCENQQEVDELWEKLTADGGEPGPCGWLKDKFGVSWQVIPRTLTDLMSDPDPVKSRRVVQAMLQMKKINIKALQDAYEQ
ncbi:MAG: VOC family protein [Micromonosporaceae bacterium]